MQDDSNTRVVKESILAIVSIVLEYTIRCSTYRCGFSLAPIEDQVDVGSAMLYGDTTFHSWWSGEEMFKL
jgi:hypothetical protein